MEGGMNRWMDGEKEGGMDGCGMNGEMDGWMDDGMDGGMDG